MSIIFIVILGFVALFGLLMVRVPIGIAMVIVGVAGFAMVVNPVSALNLLRFVPVRTVTDPSLALVPLFILMGSLATSSGVSTELFKAAHSCLGHRQGGVAMSTILASAGFGAICGSSVAGAAAMTKIALPELRKYGYADSISAGTIAAGGTLGILIPPSVMLALYGILTEEDIGRLFIAALIPGVLAALSYMAVIAYLARRNPERMPAGTRASWSHRMIAFKEIWAVLLVFAFVIGGMYAGIFTATEAAAMGATGVLLIGIVRRRLRAKEIKEAFSDAVKTSAGIFMILIGAVVFGYFLAITQAPQALSVMLISLNWSPYVILAMILTGYIILGCFLDSLALVVLTVPIIHPIILSLGFDATWFGILLAVTVGVGMTSPPMGLNIFVIKSIDHDIKLFDIYRGVMPFIVVDVLRLVLLVLIPAITLFLPNNMM